MSDSSRTQLAYTNEVTWGTIPAVAFDSLRFTGESLNFNIANITSNEIRSDRQITDLVQVDAEVSGGFNFELSYGTYDDFLLGALFDDAWDGAVAVSGSDIDASATDDSYNRAAGSFITDGVLAGQWINVAGFTEAANNGYVKVLTVTALKITVDKTLTTEAAGDAITMENDGMIRNGVTENSFVLEKFFSDKTQYMAFSGCVVSQMTLNFVTGDFLAGTFEFLGKSMARAGATAGSGAYGAASTTTPMNAVVNVKSVIEGGTEVVSPKAVNQLTVTLNNNLRGLKAIGFLGNFDIGHGRSNIGGTMQMYFEDGAEVDKFIAGTETSLELRVADAAGNGYVISFPRIKFVSQEVNAGAIDQDVFLDMEWQAIREPTNDYTVQIDRFAA